MDDLHARFVQGDMAAFEALFKTHQREVYGWIVRLVHDRASAEDLTIETFWRVYRSRARFDPARPFVAWLRRIAVNVGIDHLKRTARDREPDHDHDQERRRHDDAGHIGAQVWMRLHKWYSTSRRI